MEQAFLCLIMNDGWIKLHRRFIEWEWYRTPYMFHLYTHLILRANHSPMKWQGMTIERGQLVTGRKQLSQELGVSEQTIRTCLIRLKSTSEITIKSTNKNSIITICNYASYQSQEKEINQHINQQANQQLTNNQPTTNQQLTTNKNDKNIKNVKNKSARVKSFVAMLYCGPSPQHNAMVLFLEA